MPSRTLPPLAPPDDFAGQLRALRAALGIPRAEFASRFGLSLSTVRDWEQGHRAPDGPALVLLAVIARKPGEVRAAVTSARGAAGVIPPLAPGREAHPTRTLTPTRRPDRPAPPV